jgi:hypothetical protein
MKRTLGTMRLFRAAREIAAGVGFDIDDHATCGASDSNTTSTLGIPALTRSGQSGATTTATASGSTSEHRVAYVASRAGLSLGSEPRCVGRTEHAWRSGTNLCSFCSFRGGVAFQVTRRIR